MKIKERFDSIYANLGDKVEESIEKIINSRFLAKIEREVIGNGFMPRVRRNPAYPSNIDPSDRLCSCPMQTEGAIYNRIIYCGVCQGVIRVLESTPKVNIDHIEK